MTFLVAACVLAKPVDSQKIAGRYGFEMIVHGGSGRSKDILKNLSAEFDSKGGYKLFYEKGQVGKGNIVRFEGNRIDMDYAERSEFSGRFEPVDHMHGIWCKENGALIICFSNTKDPLPTKFESREGQEILLERLVRLPLGVDANE